VSSSRGKLGGRFGRLLIRSSEPIAVVSRTGRLVAVNPVWEDLTGWPWEIARNLRCRPRFHHDNESLVLLARCLSPPRLNTSQADLAATTRRVRIPDRDGDAHDRLITWVPLRDSAGAWSYWLAILRPVPPLDPSHATAHHDPAEQAVAEAIQQFAAEARARREQRQATRGLVGAGPRFDLLRRRIEVAAACSASVLIVGEPGTGKRLVARTIHELSPAPRNKTPLLPFDATALPTDLMEQSLLGPPPDSPAMPCSPPPIARGATILLIEPAALARDLQARLVNEFARFEAINARFISLTRTDPAQAVAEGRLRDDLLARLSTLVIPLEPLRERLDELPALASALLERANRAPGRCPSGFDTEALTILTSYDWPGNVRELLHVIEAARRSGLGDPISAADLPRSIQGALGAAHPPPQVKPVPLEERLKWVERHWLTQALTLARGNKSKAAAWLGLSRARFLRRLRETGCDPAAGSAHLDHHHADETISSQSQGSDRKSDESR